MSKASEWANSVKTAELLRPQKWFRSGVGANAVDDGRGSINGHYLTADELLGLARWRLDTFEDKT